MKVKIFIEGGGEGSYAIRSATKAFKVFFERAGFKGRAPAVRPWGSRGEAFDTFCKALADASADEFVILLVDSEDVLAINACTMKPDGPWTHLKKRDNWDQPAGATDDHGHLMVVCMEAWFLADPDCLKKYYDPGFKRDKLKQHPSIEAVSKPTVFKELEDATAQTKTKGKYNQSAKGAHSFEILARLDPAMVRAVCPHADRLLKTLNSKL